jgi:predicted dehydrogenase
MAEAAGLRVGVVGCGYWGSKHFRVLHSLASVAMVAVVDPNPERAIQLARSYPAMESYRDLDEALPHVDAVIIATPPSTHKRLALKAIAAGRHVMVEKPLATTSADAREMVAAADAKGLVLMVGHTFEYHSAVWQLRQMITEHALGDLYYMDTARLNLGLYQNDCNVLFDLAPHDVSILNFVLGAKPVSVQCWSSRHANSRLEDVAHLRLHYENPRVIANVHVSWLDPCKVRRVTMVGSKKMVIFNDLAPQEPIRIHDKGVTEALQGSPDLTQPPMSYRYGDVVSPYLVVNEPLMVEDEHFTDCVLSGMTPLTGGANGLAVVEVLEAAQRSAVEGRAVELSENQAPAASVNGATVPAPSSLLRDLR